MGCLLSASPYSILRTPFKYSHTVYVLWFDLDTRITHSQFPCLLLRQLRPSLSFFLHLLDFGFWIILLLKAVKMKTRTRMGFEHWALGIFRNREERLYFVLWYCHSDTTYPHIHISVHLDSSYSFTSTVEFYRYQAQAQSEKWEVRNLKSKLKTKTKTL